jgi:phage antirepressor YoqD-like protein
MDLIINGDDRMTVQEVSEVLGVGAEAIRKHIRELWPDKLRNGYTTYLTQADVYSIKKKMIPTTKVEGATTDYEMYQKMQEVQDWLSSKLIQLQKERDEARDKVAILTHVSKTYTVTEIAKELGLRSAGELNDLLHKRNIQFKHNGTWLPYSDYAEKGYFHIKQEVLDTGKIIYHRRITGIGREFILDLFKGK